MPLTDAAREALVEEMAQAITMKHTASKYMRFGDQRGGLILANACMPAVERMLADQDMDEVLSDHRWFTLEGVQQADGKWWASITVAVDAETKATRHFRGEGDTPTAAIIASLKALRAE